MTLCGHSGADPAGPARSGRPDDWLREEPGAHSHVSQFGEYRFPTRRLAAIRNDRLVPQKLIARLATASAASLTASLTVGWAWQVRAMSSAEAPNSMAIAASAIMVSASGPRMWMPSTASVLASARILTKPSVARLARARALAVNGNLPTL